MILTLGVYAGLGEKKEALDWLEKAYDDGAIVFSPLLHIEPELASLRDEPRFKALVAKLKLPTVPRRVPVSPV